MYLLRTAVVLLILLLACNTSTLKRPSQKLPQRAPAAILVEREIGGTILHQVLKSPTGLATDFHGNVYLCDRGNNRVIKFRNDLTPALDRGGYGRQPGLFNDPTYVTIDNQLNIWVSDSRNQRVVRLDAELNFVDEIPFSDPNDPLAFGVPSGVTATSFGALWVADVERDRVAVFDNVGQLEKFVGDFGAPGGQLQDPEKVINDYDEMFYVCDPGNARVVAYDSYGIPSERLSDPAMLEPVAATIDSSGVIWVLDQLTNRIFCFGQDGRNLVAGGVEIFGQNIGPVFPADLAFIASNKLIVSDAGGNRLLLCTVVFE